MYKVDIPKTLSIKNSLGDVTLVVATKYIDAAEIKRLYEAGIVDYGENRVEAFLEKKNLCPFKANWHFIGSLQSRKVKDMINEIDYLHSLDHLSLAKEINKYRKDILPCFIEVNISKEESKQGIYVEELREFIEEIGKYDKIKIIGLMTMAPNTTDSELIKSVFNGLVEARDSVKKLNLSYAPCDLLSMGMSHDYKLAVECHSTHVRLGKILLEGE